MFNKNDLKIKPIEKAETIPSNWYCDGNIFSLEKEAVFSSNWQYAGHIEEIKDRTNSFQIDIAGNPVIIFKNDENELTAFYNVCRHRGGPLNLLNSGKKTVLQCGYHGWTYKLDGQLRGMPRFNRVELFDKSEHCLTPVKTELWEGLVFVNLNNEAVPISNQISKIAEEIKPNNLEHKKHYKRVEYNIKCNWKIYVDNYLEGYHLPYVHPELCDFLDYREYKTIVSEFYSLQYSPINNKKNFYKGEGGAYYYFIYPNLMLNILPCRLQINQIIPISERETLVIFDYFYDDIETKEGLKSIKTDILMSDKIQFEDIEICEKVQKGVSSNVYKKGRLSVECETGVHHFQNLLRKDYISYSNNS